MCMKNSRGFTMLELLITLAVLMVLLSWAVPSFNVVLKKNRMAINANSLISAINLARSEAINRGVDVDVSANAGSWNNGWTVAVAGGGETIRVFDTPNSVFVNGDTLTITFPSSGIREAGGDNNFTVCDGGDNGRQVRITATGRANIDTKNPC